MTTPVLFLLDHTRPLEETLWVLGDLCRDRDLGIQVWVCPDEVLLRLVTPAGWEALTGHPVVSEQELPKYLEQKPLAVFCQDWRQDLAPMLAHSGIPVLLWGDELPPGVPPGSSALPEFEAMEILRRLEQLAAPQDFAGKTVLVTAGPTVEDIDPVRFITNRSSGKMGVAIAWAAAVRGARVLLVHGPMTAEVPDFPGLEKFPVRSAQQMHDVVRDHWQEAQVAVLCAAVADFRPDHYVPQKIKKIEGEGMVLALERTPDILAELGALPRHPFLVGFAAESDDVEINALNKLRKKHCDLLCANDIRKPGSGFAGDTNQITIYAPDGTVKALPMLSKQAAAQCLLEEIAKRLAARQ